MIVSLQKTPYDEAAALRIFERIDVVLRMVAEEMGLDLAAIDAPAPALPLPESNTGAEDEFEVPYTADGFYDPGSRLRLNLSEGARVRITAGPHEGDEGEVQSRDNFGNYRITFRHLINKKSNFRAPFPRVLGSWYPALALQGRLPRLPVVPVVPEAAS